MLAVCGDAAAWLVGLRTGAAGAGGAPLARGAAGAAGAHANSPSARVNSRPVLLICRAPQAGPACGGGPGRASRSSLRLFDEAGIVGPASPRRCQLGLQLGDPLGRDNARR